MEPNARCTRPRLRRGSRIGDQITFHVGKREVVLAEYSQPFDAMT
jgi:hypothetical protein